MAATATSTVARPAEPPVLPYAPARSVGAVLREPVSPTYLIFVTALTMICWSAAALLIALVPETGVPIGQPVEVGGRTLVLVGVATASACVSALLSILVVLGWMQFLHKCWSALPAGCRRMTPKRAVLFLLIPVFNLYWMFQAIVGLATDLNRFVQERQLSTRAVPRGLAVACCILLIATALPIPLVSWITPLVLLVVAIQLLRRLAETVNSIVAGRLAGQVP